jgi:hypothetical protein
MVELDAVKTASSSRLGGHCEKDVYKYDDAMEKLRPMSLVLGCAAETPWMHIREARWSTLSRVLCDKVGGTGSRV